MKQNTPTSQNGEQQVSEREVVALWLKHFNCEWNKERAEAQKNDFWKCLPKWGGGACNYGNYANQNEYMRLEKDVIIYEN
jgi:hypothetical protein